MGCSDHATSSSLLDSLSGTPRSGAAALASQVPLSAALALPGGSPVWSGDSTPPVPLPQVTSTHPTVPLLTKSGLLPSPATRPWSSTPQETSCSSTSSSPGSPSVSHAVAPSSVPSSPACASEHILYVRCLKNWNALQG